MDPLNKGHLRDQPFCLLYIERLSFFRGDFFVECVYMITFSLSFDQRFVLIRRCILLKGGVVCAVVLKARGVGSSK